MIIVHVMHVIIFFWTIIVIHVIIVHGKRKEKNETKCIYNYRLDLHISCSNILNKIYEVMEIKQIS